ncbi:MAG TPA: sigma-70 family RNA polymerase sigma factor [Desulfomonilaceae bacterium]|nr:sigma-70 family RNA polymerase sigma factor [Desulfomonilaceae bacterium]
MQDFSLATVKESGIPVDEDTKLVLEAQGDPAAFQALYDRWAVRVYQYFYHRTGDTDSSEDLTSQLFLAAYQSLPRYRHHGHFAPWLFTIARNLFNEYYRKRKREVPLEMAQNLVASIDPVADSAHADEIQRLIKLVRSLPEQEQELIRLRYVVELPFADMAILLNKREAAVKKSLYRLQARLQGLLEGKNE